MKTTRLFLVPVLMALFISFAIGQSRPAQPAKPPAPPPPAPREVSFSKTEDYNKYLSELTWKNRDGQFERMAVSERLLEAKQLGLVIKMEIGSMVKLSGVNKLTKVRGHYARDAERIKDECEKCDGVLLSFRFSFDESSTCGSDEREKYIIMIDERPLDQDDLFRLPKTSYMFMHWPSVYMLGSVYEQSEKKHTITTQVRLLVGKTEVVRTKSADGSTTRISMGQIDRTFKPVFLTSFIAGIDEETKSIQWMKFTPDENLDTFQLPTRK